jgi:hypothetical protein
MSRWEQYEIWVWGNDGWRLTCSLADIETAVAVLSARKRRVRLVCVLFEASHRLEAHTVAEIGETRERP